MPTYQSICTKCEKRHEYYSSVEKRDSTPICCGIATARKLFNAPQGYVDNPRYMTQYKKLY